MDGVENVCEMEVENDGYWGTACSIFSPTVAFSVIRLLIVLHEPLCRDLMSLTF